MKTFKYYHDSQHGWLAVKKNLLKELSISQKISSYSYQRGQTVYLEEDSDLDIFFKAYNSKYGIDPICESYYHDGNSPIRSYDCFVREQ